MSYKLPFEIYEGFLLFALSTLPRVEAQTTCKTQANSKARDFFLNNGDLQNKPELLHISHENKSRCLGLNDWVVLLSMPVLCNTYIEGQ